jgi:hypothetical protein
MVVTDEVRALIINRVPSGEIRKVATRQGMRNLRQDGWRLIREGKTTPDEVLTATKEEHVGEVLPGDVNGNGSAVGAGVAANGGEHH